MSANATDYLSSQFSGPVVQATVQGMLNAIQEPLALIQYWSALSIATAQDVDATLDYVGELVGYPRPLVTNVFTNQYLLILSDAALPPVDSIPYGLGDALGIDRGDCESATPPALSGEITNTTSNCGFVQSAAVAHGGTHSYVFVRSLGAGNDCYVDQPSPSIALNGLIPGHTYTLSAWFYIPGSGVTGVNTRIMLFYYNGGWSAFTGTCSNTYNAWQFVTVTGTIPLATIGAFWRLDSLDGSNGDGFYVDDITLIDSAGGEFDTAIPAANNTMPATWYQALLPIYAEAMYNGLSIQVIDELASWANTGGGGTGYTISWNAYDNVTVVFTTYIDPRYLYIINSIVAALETLPLIVFEEP
jgi:hypothetical protein